MSKITVMSRKDFERLSFLATLASDAHFYGEEFSHQEELDQLLSVFEACEGLVATNDVPTGTIYPVSVRGAFGRMAVRKERIAYI